MRASIAAVVFCLCSCGDQDHASESLVASLAEPPGANCAEGGQAIESGLDTNGNGVLDASEVTHTSYVCAGANGEQPLIRIDPEPDGSHCAAGGSAVNVGIDTNGDSILEDSEIETTSYICNPTNPTVIDGSFTVNNSVDAAQLVGVTHITGNLTIDAVGLSSIDLGALATVDGTINVTGFSGTMIAMPALTATGALEYRVAAALAVPVLATAGGIQINNVAVAALPALTTVGNLSFGGDALTSVSVPVLTTAASISISNSSALTAIDLPHVMTTSLTITSDQHLATLTIHLTSAGNVWLQDLPALAAIDLSSLTRITGILVIENTAATSLDVSALTSIDSWLQISNTSFTALSFPALTSVASTLTGGEGASIADNSALTSITAPMWTTFGPTPATPNVGVQIYGNPLLPTCMAQAVLAQTTSVNSFVAFNDDAATCN
jgi:hypothetical protein